MPTSLPLIPAKRYFTIGEVSDLCGVKPHVLRYWEQEFSQLRPVKRRGNRRYYQRHEVLLIRRIRELLYDHGFTIYGARNKLEQIPASTSNTGEPMATEGMEALVQSEEASGKEGAQPLRALEVQAGLRQVREELFEIRRILLAG